ncbi:AcrR family transcriptional regulator [Prauserella isguenensis]|uniref:AcrR family transcriptional regulator n=1 Tax=Prauserella isguenensis TaxID=1470180 RepID=A0A839S1R7_9PSEU|nr:AcrR family transcriptional regulator [Prauserella isguenensis]
MTSTPHRTADDGSRRRGRRPAGEDTRTALLEAARAEFADGGYTGATVRAIATRAGVDAAMVNHWFGSKDQLFAEAVLQLPFDLSDVVATVTSYGRDRLGEGIVRTFVGLWDGAGGDRFTAVIRSVTSSSDALDTLRGVLVAKVIGPVVATAAADRPELRASLCASQVVGLGMARYVARFEPLSSADPDTVVAAVAPTLQRYLTGDLEHP